MYPAASFESIYELCERVSEIGGVETHDELMDIVAEMNKPKDRSTIKDIVGLARKLGYIIKENGLYISSGFHHEGKEKYRDLLFERLPGFKEFVEYVKNKGRYVLKDLDKDDPELIKTINDARKRSGDAKLKKPISTNSSWIWTIGGYINHGAEVNIFRVSHIGKKRMVRMNDTDKFMTPEPKPADEIKQLGYVTFGVSPGVIRLSDSTGKVINKLLNIFDENKLRKHSSKGRRVLIRYDSNKTKIGDVEYVKLEILVPVWNLKE